MAQSLDARLRRLESRTPSAAAHGYVAEMIERGDARVYICRCAYGHTGCSQYPELRVVAKHPQEGKEPR